MWGDAWKSKVCRRWMKDQGLCGRRGLLLFSHDRYQYLWFTNHSRLEAVINISIEACHIRSTQAYLQLGHRRITEKGLSEICLCWIVSEKHPHFHIFIYKFLFHFLESQGKLFELRMRFLIVPSTIYLCNFFQIFYLCQSTDKKKEARWCECLEK